MHNENMICTMKYSGTILKCIFMNGQTFDVDDTKPLDIEDSIIGYVDNIGDLVPPVAVFWYR